MLPADDALIFDGFGPVPVMRPATVAELQDIVRAAGSRGEALYPIGGRTMLDLGNPPTKPGPAVDLTRMHQVIDYPARDMTITVQAGITIAELQGILAREKQRLPVDVPLADKATLGGAMACNVSGPRRYGFGTLRDYVIGISVVNDRGEEVKAGGRVVKNVAGYDLCKLFTGSLGTLGIITQVTLKVRPRPEASVLLGIGCRDDELAGLLDRLHGSRTRPVCIDLLSPPLAQNLYSVLSTQFSVPSTDWLILVGFEDNRAAVDWQVEQCRKENSRSFSRAWTDAEPIWRWLTDWPVTAASAVSFKANLPSGAVAGSCLAAEPDAHQLLAHAGNGIMHGHFGVETTLDQARDFLAKWRSQAVAVHGNLIITRCPPEWKPALGVWGEPRGDWELMQEIKAKLDPRGLFNPGRFVGGR